MSLGSWGFDSYVIRVGSYGLPLQNGSCEVQAKILETCAPIDARDAGPSEQCQFGRGAAYIPM